MDPQIAVTVVAILGALEHAFVAILRAVRDYRVALVRADKLGAPATSANHDNGHGSNGENGQDNQALPGA